MNNTFFFLLTSLFITTVHIKALSDEEVSYIISHLESTHENGCHFSDYHLCCSRLLKALKNYESFPINYTHKETGDTLLHIVCKEDTNTSDEILPLLLERKPHTNIKNNKGETPLHSCISYKKAPMDYLEALLAEGADVNAADINGTTPIVQACINHCPVEVHQLLLDYGAQITKAEVEAALYARHMVSEEKKALEEFYSDYFAFNPKIKKRLFLESLLL